MTSHLSIRMYDVGFGDCFLIVVPGATKRTILVDAGFHSQGKGAFGGRDLAVQVIEDVVKAVGKKRIDVVIGTHRHQDHITVFNAPEWDGVEVGEVWLPWVDDPANPAATKLWKKNQGFAEALAAALPMLGIAEDQRAEIEFMLWNAGVLGGPDGFAAWSNLAALDKLRSGFAARDRDEARYLPEKAAIPESFTAPALPGVKIHVLGPPRDVSKISKGNPEKDGETYRALALRALEKGAAEPCSPPPFGDAWLIPLDELDAKPVLDGEELGRLHGLARTLDPLMAAKALDDMINATSLVLVLQIGSARLLLPGDAEWGTWKLILAQPAAVELLRGTTFLKVGHHGSHNATPVDLVEKVLKAGVQAMTSTQEGPGTYRNDIPLGELLEALDEHDVTNVRSDEHDAELPKGYKRGPDAKWIDLTLPC